MEKHRTTSTVAIILAAGEGTRLGTTQPKALLPLCGRPLISHVVATARAAGLRRLLVVVGRGAKEVAAVLPRGVEVVLQPRRRGTADAVRCARQRLGRHRGDVVVLYGDAPLIRPETVRRLLETQRAQGARCTVLTAQMADPQGYGRIIRDGRGAVAGIVEDRDATAAQRAIQEINAGHCCWQAETLWQALAAVQPSRVTGEWYLTDALRWVVAAGEGAVATVAAIEPAEAWGVNTLAELAQVQTALRWRLLAEHLRRGVRIVDPATTYIDAGARIGRDTVIEPCTVLAGDVVIGRGCRIGPFARLRPGARVADGTRIGNFVELVRTRVGRGVRVNHMTYLGDTTVGDQTNIGAGTITANFDGTHKHPTRIGAHSFIGSDTVLVAPVRVGNNAVTGAGTVVPRGHHVRPGQIVVGVPARPLVKRSARKGRQAHGAA